MPARPEPGDLEKYCPASVEFLEDVAHALHRIEPNESDEGGDGQGKDTDVGEGKGANSSSASSS